MGGIEYRVLAQRHLPREAAQRTLHERRSCRSGAVIELRWRRDDQLARQVRIVTAHRYRREIGPVENLRRSTCRVPIGIDLRAGMAGGSTRSSYLPLVATVARSGRSGDGAAGECADGARRVVEHREPFVTGFAAPLSWRHGGEHIVRPSLSFSELPAHAAHFRWQSLPRQIQLRFRASITADVLFVERRMPSVTKTIISQADRFLQVLRHPYRAVIGTSERCRLLGTASSGRKADGFSCGSCFQGMCLMCNDCAL